MLHPFTYQAIGKTFWFCFPRGRSPLVQTQWLSRIGTPLALPTAQLCFSVLQLEKPPEKEEEHAPEFIKVRENLRRIATLTSEERVL